MLLYEDAVYLVLMTRRASWWQAAGTSIVLWDHVTTLGEEIEFIWVRKWSFTTFLYLVTRYAGDLAFIHAAISTWATGEFLYEMCPSVIQVQMWLSQATLLAMNGIVVKRVVCIYNKDKRVLWALMTVWVALAIHSVVVTSLAFGVRSVVKRVQSINLYETCYIMPPNVLPAQHWTFALAMFAFDTLVFGLSIVQGIRFACENRKMKRDGRKVAITEHLWRTRRSLASVLLRDSILFPVINLVLAMLLILASVARLQPSWEAPIILAAAAAIPTLGCRLVLNLRNAYYKPFSEEYFQSQLQNSPLAFQD